MNSRRRFNICKRETSPLSISHKRQSVPAWRSFPVSAMSLKRTETRCGFGPPLQIINAELDSYFAEQEGDLDADTRFCTAWFEQYSMKEGAFGEADVLARAKNSSVEGVAESEVCAPAPGRCACSIATSIPMSGNPPRIAVPIRGNARSILFVRLSEAEKRKPGDWRIGLEGEQVSLPVRWRIASTPSAIAKAGRRRRWLTTRSLAHGRISRRLPGRTERKDREICFNAPISRSGGDQPTE